MRASTVPEAVALRVARCPRDRRRRRLGEAASRATPRSSRRRS